MNPHSATFWVSEVEFKTLRVSEWKTVDYPVKSLGTASITKTKYRRGNTYLMEGVDGYELLEVTKAITVTQLKIKGKVVMIDDPMHWIGMKRLAEACRGKVLVAGLGLGLILHHLATNKNVKSIDVVEINKDVIDLIKPLLPNDDRVRIHPDNVLSYKWVHGDYDTIVLDLWVRTPAGTVVAGETKYNVGIIETMIRFQLNNPNAAVFVWGHRDPIVNPAVKRVSDSYLRFVKLVKESY